ncbi:putative RNA 3'-terminal phosphate cyclase-like protein [Gregarina niphandrodes]|uniref:RNA 3'-terminal phosphate cyclase-like protein n=1 Tax=Gregarina niphandrodes TaxID=110365 RepID=A0A023B2V0_GRENI|nr:putative RNA 3'-terminal phosphate cyclase-like protein [Gregarina niphandrodes]EZG55156.1 putative RNA 3'-terminal phosphate cyclase-like protein [Gregarina niphandrodes]|eukprot:XP_011131744.1 putative RNA 3'-terminal phosphate cyclase-like protein [Gregarina niphandrodes]
MAALGKEITYHDTAGFRQRIALSAITNRPVSMKDIRVKTENPGLRPSEACILHILERVSENVAVDVRNGSTDLLVEPGLLVGRDYAFTVECPPDRGLVYYLEFLVMIAPFMKHPANINLEGITDHPHDLSMDAFRTGLNAYTQKIGLPEMGVNVIRRGLLPEGGGCVQFTCGVLKAVEPFKLIYGGRIARVRGTVFTCHMNAIFGTKTIESARNVLNELLADVHIYTEPQSGEKGGKSPGFGLTLVAETVRSGIVYVADGLIDKNEADQKELTAREKMQPTFLGRRDLGDLIQQKSARKTSETITEKLGREVALRLLAELCEGGAVDSAFQWLPIYFMAVADDDKVSRVVTGRLTQNTVLLLRHINDFLSLRYQIDTHQAALESLVKLPEQKTESQKTESQKTDLDVGEKAADKNSHSGDNVKEDLGEETIYDDEDDDPPFSLAAAEGLQRARRENRFVLTCRGVGLANISRVTF